MILTVTLNPAVDMDYDVRSLQWGGRYRAGVTRRSPGGSGINISIVLSRLGFPSIATGFLGGFSGSYILNILRREGISTNFVHTVGETRINVCVVDTAGDVETRLHEPGGEISPGDRAAFFRNYGRVLSRANMVCIGGSLPPGINASVYPEMVRLAKDNSIPVLLHPTPEDLPAALEESPALVKLDYQASRLRTGFEEDDLETFMGHAAKLHGRGVRWVLISLSRERVAFSSPKGAWIAEGPLSEMLYLYATEDALLAGMASAMHERLSPEDTVRLAMACNWECSTHPEKFPQNRACIEDLIPRVLLSPLKF